MKQITRDDFNKIFMQPGIFCKETGFEGRNDIALYYDMLNRTVDYSELNAIIKKYNIKAISIERGFDDKWKAENKKDFFDNVDLHNITGFYASDVDYELVLKLCPNLQCIKLDLKENQIVDVSKSTKLIYLAISGFNGSNVKGIKDGSSIVFWGKRGKKFEFPNSLPRRLKTLGFIYYKDIDLDSLNLEHLEIFTSCYGGKSIILNADNKFVPYLESIRFANGDCSFLTSSFFEKAQSLKVLMIENCTPIASLKGVCPLYHVSITGTDILDKDLTPLMSSKYVNVTNKKGFNIKNKDLPKNGVLDPLTLEFR